MKLRFYLRGLGIGIAMTAVILHFVYGNQDNTMTDEEVKARALELGMIENTLLSENGETGGESVSESDVVSENETGDNREGVSENDANENSEAVSENESGEDTENSSENNSDDADNTDNSENADDANNNGYSDSGDNSDDNAIDNAEDENSPDSESNNNDEEYVNDEEVTNGSTSGNNPGEVIITVYGGDGSDTVARRLEEAGVIDSASEYDAYLCANGYDKRICTGDHRIPAGATYEEITIIITTRN